MKNMRCIKLVFVLLLVALLLVTILFAVVTTKYINTTAELAIAVDSLMVMQDQLVDKEAELVYTQQQVLVAEATFTNLEEEYTFLQGEFDTASAIIASLTAESWQPHRSVTEMEIDMLAKTVWGEARGCDQLGQSAVVWCVLNRVDAGWGSIAEVITAKDQFHGYSSSFPVTPEIRLLVQDVVVRWQLEKLSCGDVGRTLPGNYLYFRSDSTGIGNIFRTNWSGQYEVWDWDCSNPYA